MDKEGNEGARKHEGKHGIGIVVPLEHGKTEHTAEGYAEAAGEAIDAVNHIHGIDDAHTCEDGEGNANPPGIALDAP